MPWQEKAAIYADAQVGHEDTLSAFYQEHSMVDFIEEAVKRSAQSKNEYGLGWFGTKKDFEAKLEEYAEFLKRLPDETISVSKVDLLDKLKIVQNDLASNRLMLFTAELPKDNGGEIDISRALWAMQLQYQAAFQHKPGRIVAISDSKSLILKTTAEIENVVTILYNFVTIQPINGIYQAIILASKQA
jgi:hypothetical protein